MTPVMAVETVIRRVFVVTSALLFVRVNSFLCHP